MKTKFNDKFFEKQCNSKAIIGGKCQLTTYTTSSPDGNDSETYTYDDCGTLLSYTYCD